MANNAAFIAAPRERTRALNLGGGAFLHNYDANLDADKSTLELITRTKVVVVAGALDELTRQFHGHKLALELSNIPLRAAQENNVFNHPPGEVPVFLSVGKKLKVARPKFPPFLKDVPLFPPSRQSDVRADVDLMLADSGLEPFDHAEVDDMALTYIGRMPIA